MHTRRPPCEDEGTHQGGVSASQGRPKIAEKPSANKRSIRQILLHSLQEASTLWTP